jgi:hypothetical protein
MKRTVLKFGLISGAALSAMMLVSMSFHDQLGFDLGMVVGYTTMVLAFLLVFAGVRSYRDDVAGGTVGFGRAFVVGGLIALVASLCYVATWEVYYYTTKPDFIGKYQEHELAKARAAGESEESIAKQKAEMEKFALMYEKLPYNAAMTLAEPLPVALIMSLVAAGVLSRRRRKDGAIENASVST